MTLGATLKWTGLTLAINKKKVKSKFSKNYIFQIWSNFWFKATKIIVWVTSMWTSKQCFPCKTCSQWGEKNYFSFGLIYI